MLCERGQEQTLPGDSPGQGFWRCSRASSTQLHPNSLNHRRQSSPTTADSQLGLAEAFTAQRKILLVTEVSVGQEPTFAELEFRRSPDVDAEGVSGIFGAMWGRVVANGAANVFLKRVGTVDALPTLGLGTMLNVANRKLPQKP